MKPTEASIFVFFVSIILMSCEQSEVVHSKLDTGRFKFNTSLPVDDRGIPTEKKFRQEKCAIFSYYLMRLTPDTGAIVDIE